MIYHKPYSQIIEKGQIRNSIDGLTHRSLADSCEIEYVKKNGEIINDFDNDGEIQEKERLHFPVWQGPDYEDEERWVRLNSAGAKEGTAAQTRNYYISNMVFNENECKPLDQTQFISENAKIFVKILKNNDRQDRAEIEAEIDGKTEKLYADNSIGNYLQTQAFYIAKLRDYQSDIYEGSDGNKYIRLGDTEYRVIATEKNIVDDSKEYLKIKYNKQFLDKSLNEPAYCIFSDYYDSSFLKKRVPQWLIGNFYAVCEQIKKMDFSVITDISPTRSKLETFFKKHKRVKIFYYSGHGDIENNVPYLKIFNSPNSSEIDSKITDTDLRNMNANAELVYFNACQIGKELVKMKSAFNAKAALGWTNNVWAVPVSAYDIFVFKNLKTMNLGSSTIKDNTRIPMYDFIMKNFVIKDEKNNIYKETVFHSYEEIDIRYSFFKVKPIIINSDYFINDLRVDE
ncbi:MAG: hypothetical protein M0R46_16845 [Candidatus Muirbacterium halophilum]|nr:hypothetical protein [Candidatus Muirbacterium halophilum]